MQADRVADAVMKRKAAGQAEVERGERADGWEEPGEAEQLAQEVHGGLAQSCRWLLAGLLGAKSATRDTVTPVGKAETTKAEGADKEAEEVEVWRGWTYFISQNAGLLTLYGLCEAFALPAFANSEEDTQVARVIMIFVLWQIIKK